MGGTGVWFQSGRRGRGSSPQVGDGRRVGHCFPQSRVVGCDWWGIKEMGGSGANEGEGTVDFVPNGRLLGTGRGGGARDVQLVRT